MKARRTYTSEDGFMESVLIEHRSDPNATKRWLKDCRPDLYDRLFLAAKALSPHLLDVETKLERDNVGKALQARLKKQPEIRGSSGARAVPIVARPAPDGDQAARPVHHRQPLAAHEPDRRLPRRRVDARRRADGGADRVSRQGGGHGSGRHQRELGHDRRPGAAMGPRHLRARTSVHASVAGDRPLAPMANYLALQNEGPARADGADQRHDGTANHTGFFPQGRLR
jgi:hypothetical protein